MFPGEVSRPVVSFQGGSVIFFLYFSDSGKVSVCVLLSSFVSLSFFSFRHPVVSRGVEGTQLRYNVITHHDRRHSHAAAHFFSRCYLMSSLSPLCLPLSWSSWDKSSVDR